jgi:hypothetical protein
LGFPVSIRGKTSLALATSITSHPVAALAHIPKGMGRGAGIKLGLRVGQCLMRVYSVQWPASPDTYGTSLGHHTRLNRVCSNRRAVMK